MNNTLIPFIREFAKAPTVVASVIPSGKALARQMTSPIPSMGQPVVVELGSGTSAFSRTIQERLDGRGWHIALDINERFTALLTERFAGLQFVGGRGEQGNGLADIPPSGTDTDLESEGQTSVGVTVAQMGQSEQGLPAGVEMPPS